MASWGRLLLLLLTMRLPDLLVEGLLLLSVLQGGCVLPVRSLRWAAVALLLSRQAVMRVRQGVHWVVGRRPEESQIGGHRSLDPFLRIRGGRRGYVGCWSGLGAAEA